MTLVQEATGLEVLERVFERKRSNFLDDYGLRGSPLLVWQIAPEATCSIDLSSADVAQSVRAGSTASTSDGWWHGFRGPQHPALVFDGLASHRKDHLAGYVTELHADGHFFAAVWTFPEQPDRSPGVAPFYADAFADALDVGLRVLQKAGMEGPFLATCTMCGAESLPLIHHRGVLAPAALRNALRWPFHAVDAKSKDDVRRAMTAQFMRIYGRVWRPE